MQLHILEHKSISQTYAYSSQPTLIDNYTSEHYHVQVHHRLPCNLHIFQILKVSVDRKIRKYKIFTTILTEKIFLERSKRHNLNVM